MKFQTIQPPEILKPFVRYFWSLESDGDPAEQKNFRTIADGCPGIIYQHADKGTYHQNGKALPETFLFGQTTKHAEITVSGEFSTVGIYLVPNAIKSIFGFHAGELTDSCMDANLLAQKQNLDLSEQLANASSVEKKVEILSTFLGSQMNRNNKRNNENMQYALSLIAQSKGIVPLNQLQEELKLSERTFERHFKEYVGISPKLFSRICRFQSSLKQLRESDYLKLSDIAFENNYADQSHFIRSFKEFSGVSPQQYQKQLTEVIENFAEIVI
jgi:AraC-like DNA-binding protein